MHFQQTDIIVKGDEIRLEMLFKNLIENAIQYTDNKTKPIQISVNILKPNEKSKKIKINIIDQGIGINEKDLPYIFEPFYRIDFSRSKKTGGFGLGLYICKKIVDLHKGQISIKSKKNMGTDI